MLLVVDVGNTNTVIGIFENGRMLKDWRIRTERNATADEMSVLLYNLFAGGRVDFGNITRTIISCVVPPVVRLYEEFCGKYLSHHPIWVNAATAAGIPIRYRNPAEVGADRIVNAVAAYEKYPMQLIVIDFGTATTFDVVSAQGEYIGGAIAPGVMISAEALFKNASKLPRVDLLTIPTQVIGQDTAESMQSGIIFGYAGLVDGLVRRLKKELGGATKVIATGGLARLIHPVSETIEAVEPDLTLEGLRIISERIP